MDDRFDNVLRHAALKARVFFAGNLCSVANFDADRGTGHLHLLRGGTLEVTGPDGRAHTLQEPSLLFFPRPTNHRLRPDRNDGADLVCASVEFGSQGGNPLVEGLPGLMVLPLSGMPTLRAVLGALFDEAFAAFSGRSAALDRLSEVVLIHLLRHAVDHGLLTTGVMAGLADPRLAVALGAMHAQPQRSWTLADLAAQAGMSRARFAARFAQVVGSPPGEYLARWRISVAQGLLAKGRPLKTISDDVGYSSSSALARAFVQHTGQGPAAWLAARTGTAAGLNSVA